MNDLPENDFVSLIVPVYNSASTVDALYFRIVAAMDAAGRRFELIFIDDASLDGSAERARALARRDRCLRLLVRDRNAGPAAAVRAGIAHARGSIVVTLDDDLQHRPEDIPRLLQRLSDAADVRALVMAVATTRQRGGLRDVLGVTANILCNAFLRRPLPLRTTTFCAFHRVLGATLVQLGAPRGSTWITPLVQSAARTLTVPLAIDASRVGASRYTFETLWSLLQSRTRSFVPGRVFALAFFATIVASILITMGIWRGRAGGVFAMLSSLAALIAAGGIVLAWRTATQRGAGTQADPPVILFVPEEEITRT